MNTPYIFYVVDFQIQDLCLSRDNYHHLANFLSCNKFNELINRVIVHQLAPDIKILCIFCS